MIDELIGQKIRELRKKRNLSMKALAEIVDTSQQQIDRLEKGQRRMTIKWLQKICAALNHDYRNLLSEPGLDESRAGGKTSKAKVIGAIKKDGEIEWYEPGDIYPVIFGRPESVNNIRMFALRVNGAAIKDYSTGSELIFSEVIADSKVDHAKLAVFQNSNGSYYVGEAKTKIRKHKIKAMLIKSIRNE